jgi:threonine aldolase
MPIDLRSDTVTRPSLQMRAAMASAEVGDDVFRDDPTVLKLEQRVAELLGMEAALYVPSGTMGNQLCLKAHSRHGDSLIAHAMAHILYYETGAPCAISGLQPRVIDTPGGTFTPEQALPLILPRNIHHSRNRIIAMENTHNRCGGAVWPREQFAEVARFGREHGLAVHLDGARLWNACAATGTQPAGWCQHVDSVSVCFSKGLGAPIGSALAGTRAFVEECMFFRKMFGGQMRQAGIIAAAALYALEHNRERLAQDHDNAKLLAAILAAAPGLRVETPPTNILMLDITAQNVSAQQLADAVVQEVWLLPIGPQRLRAVTHLDVSRDDCQRAGELLAQAMQRLAQAAS